MMPRLLAPLAAAAVMAGTAGCGGDDPVRVDGGTLRLAAAEYRLTPAEAELAAPSRITVEIANDGTRPHRLALGKARSALAMTGTIAPGGKARLTATLEPGTYRLFCVLQNHDTLGLYADLRVEDHGSSGTED